MRLTIFNQRNGILCAALVLLLGSCKKDNDAATQNQVIYTVPGSAAYNITESRFTLSRGVILASLNTGFPVALTRAAGSGIQVSARIDTSQLAVYDSTYRTVSNRFATEAFSLQNNGHVTIAQGALQSADSVKVTVGDASKIDFTKNYVIPVTLTSSGNNVPLSSNRSVMFIRVFFTNVTASLQGAAANRTIPVVINRTPGGDVVTPAMTAFNAAVNVPGGSNLTVTIINDNALVSSFNSKNGTAYQAFPDGSFRLVKNSVTISAGKSASADSFQLQVTTPASFATGKSYLLPLKIKDEGPVAPDKDNSIVYVVLEAKQQNIDPANPNPGGTIINRGGWTATASSTEATYSKSSPAFVFDGDYATGWQADLAFGSNLPVRTFTIDMKSGHLLKGISFTPMYWSYSDQPFRSGVTVMEVFSSVDGVNWVSQGTYKGAAPSGDASSPDTRYIKFYGPVQARYLRFSMTDYEDYAPGFGELNTFE
ncbi:MAG TPA: DUF1735 domain-containing protein [Chitinophaga sp.]|uniref:BT_3987 domain-containing protein n=1 Tax=Chitinophaga sp. TaxID=1869181 RepID=UPI002CB76674|nr:DUF1735 domain-containing protein [Chitinophaga sp.]HVI43935.1 DUF1735 domain-containing protein [Chitinophaga sp.]